MTREPVCRSLGLGVLAVVVALSAACSSAGSKETPSSAVPAQGAAAGQDQNAATGPAATLAEAENLVPQVRSVTARLVERCLREKGVTEYPPQTTDAAPRTVGGPTASPDEATAAKDGYGVLKGARKDAKAPSFEFSSPAAAKKYRVAVSGAKPGSEESGKGRTALGGCLGVARTTVYGQVSAPEDPIAGIQEAARKTFDQDDTVRTALTTWSDCLQKSGYPRLTDPEDAQRYAQYFHYPVGARPDGSVPHGGPWPKVEATSKEVAMATADANCATKADLNRIQEAAWTTALGRTLEQRSAELFGFRQAMTEALERGQAALQS
ncbi:hypothetical protein ACWKSP_41235 [Micromonosporaceae bacterium Da 78-11]